MSIAAVARRHCSCCWVSRYKERGCRLPLPREGDGAWMSGGKYQANHEFSGRLSDALVYWEVDDDRAAAVELKGRNPSVGIVVEQLQNGARVIEQIIDGYPSHVRFVPALLHKRIDYLAYQAFRGKSIVFR